MPKKIICLTPVKNEAWILEKFLKSTSLWADHIIIADQGSTDGSREIAEKFSKVILIENNSQVYNELERQKMLIDESRKIHGDKILIALDADESLTADSINNKEWETIRHLDCGTVIRFIWVNLRLDKNVYWNAPDKMPFGFIDDGSSHIGLIIHSPRIPTSKKKLEYFAKNIKVMHFQYTDWERMKSKHRWYQCWERINYPKKSGIGIYRQYHHMYAVKKDKLKTIPGEWLGGYKIKGIDYSSIKSENVYYWDFEVINLFKKYGVNFFSKVAIWDRDWNEVAELAGFEEALLFNDPRTIFEKLISFWSEKTQYFSNSLIVKIIDKLLKMFLKI